MSRRIMILVCAILVALSTLVSGAAYAGSASLYGREEADDVLKADAATAVSDKTESASYVVLTAPNPTKGMTAHEILAFLGMPGARIGRELDGSTQFFQDSDIVGTGSLLYRAEGGLPSTLVIMGDASGSGRVSVSELVRVAMGLREPEKLQPPFLTAVDFDGDGKISVSDLVHEASLLLGNTASAEKPTTSSSPVPADILAKIPHHYVTSCRQLGRWGLFVDVIDNNGFRGCLVSPPSKIWQGSEQAGVSHDFLTFQGRFADPVVRNDHSYTLPIADFKFEAGGDVRDDDEFGISLYERINDPESYFMEYDPEFLEILPAQGSFTLYVEGASASEIEQDSGRTNFSYGGLRDVVQDALRPENGPVGVLLRSDVVLTPTDLTWTEILYS